MKKILPILFLISSFAYGQYPGKNPELLLNKELIVNGSDAVKSSGYDNFYTDATLKTRYETNLARTRYESIAGKTFKVVGIEDIMYNGNIKKTVFILDNNETGKLYYVYNPYSEYAWYFTVVGGLKLPDGYYCESIITKKDKFNGEITSDTPYVDGVSFIKVTAKGKTTTYMSLSTPGSTANVGGKGVTILLENGKKITKPMESVDVSVGSKDFQYSAFITLSATDLKTLSQNKITDFRLYIYDAVVYDGDKIKEFLKCLTK